jgi:threonine dehydrogenase-like Zn-dependent dehydrogenase
MSSGTGNPTMRAAVLTGPGKCELQRVAMPRPSASQVRVRLEGCGVCGSNLALWQGRPWFGYPSEPGQPGHEGWGIVDAVGGEVDRAWLGRRVALLSYRAYAEYDLADAAHLVQLPDSLPAQPFPGEALGCAMNIFRRSAIEPGQNVAIVGAGFLGLLLVQLATRAGAKVIAISRRAYALELAARLGAVETIPMDDHVHVVKQVMKATGGSGCERVIEAVGEQGPLDLAGELSAERARLIIAGYHQDARRVNLQLWNWRGLDVINAHERAPEAYLRGMREAIDAVQSGALEPGALYTHAFPLSELGAALSALETRPDGLLKSWVRL